MNINLFLAIKNWLLGKDFMLWLFLTSCIEGVKVLNKLTRWCWILTLVGAIYNIDKQVLTDVKPLAKKETKC